MIEQEWIKVVQPSKFVAKVTFSSPEELKEKRSILLKRSSSICNVLDFRAFPQATPPFININAEKHEFISRLIESLPEFDIQEAMRTELDKSRQLVLIANSPYCDIHTVRKRMNDYGPLIYSASFNVENSSKKFFTVAFQDDTVAEDLLKQRFIFIGKDIVVIKRNEPPEVRQKIPELILKLSNLPLMTSDWHLKDILTQLNATYWKVPFSRNQKRIPVCYVSFNNLDDLFVAQKTRLKLKGQELRWSKPDDKICERCLSQDHDFRGCRTYRPTNFQISKGRPIPNSMSSPVNPDVSHARALGDSRNEIAQKEEEVRKLKELNDMLEVELERSIRLQAMKREIENANDNPDCSETLYVRQISSPESQSKLQIMEERIASMEKLLNQIAEAVKRPSDSTLEEKEKLFESKLAAMDRSIGIIHDTLATLSTPSPKRKLPSRRL